jgi:uronate dehydrogenase
MSCHAMLGRVVLTGAAGRIGSVVRAGLREGASRLVLVDRLELSPRDLVERVHRLDLGDLEAVTAAMADADAVVHLGGVPDEAPMRDLLEGNVLGTYHVLEAARRQRVRRVVLASSNRVTGFYPTAQRVGPDMPPRPDTLYGASKVAVEALGRLYADKFGLQVVCLRIGSFESEPSEPRHLSTWLSHRDCLGFVRAALTSSGVHYEAVYAVSANTRGFWDTTAGERLGYSPVDDAEDYADRVAGASGWPAGGAQSGEYASPEYTLRHGMGREA